MKRSTFLFALGAVWLFSGTLVSASTIQYGDHRASTSNLCIPYECMNNANAQTNSLMNFSGNNKYMLADISSDVMNGLKGVVMDQVKQQPQSDKTQQTNSTQVPKKSNESSTKDQNKNAQAPKNSKAKSATSTRECHRGNRYCGTY